MVLDAAETEIKYCLRKTRMVTVDMVLARNVSHPQSGHNEFHRILVSINDGPAESAYLTPRDYLVRMQRLGVPKTDIEGSLAQLGERGTARLQADEVSYEKVREILCLNEE